MGKCSDLNIITTETENCQISRHAVVIIDLRRNSSYRSRSKIKLFFYMAVECCFIEGPVRLSFIDYVYVEFL